MAEPNPLWGFHLVAGALTGALVRQEPDGSWTVEEVIERRLGGGARDSPKVMGLAIDLDEYLVQVPALLRI